LQTLRISRTTTPSAFLALAALAINMALFLEVMVNLPAYLP